MTGISIFQHMIIVTHEHQYYDKYLKRFINDVSPDDNLPILLLESE